MPLYDFKCENKSCKTKVFEIFISADDVSEGTKCQECGEKAKRVYSPAKHRFDFKYGFDPGLGQYFDSARQRDNFVGANDLRRMKD